MMTRFSAVAATLLLLAACSGGADEPAQTGGKTAKPGTAAGKDGTPGTDTPGTDTPGTGTPGADPEKPLPKADPMSTACQLPELKATDVKPTFLVFNPPATQPAAAKGGKIEGKYTIDKATVYLPTSTKNLVKPAQSTGTVNGWAIFSGKDYRLTLKADLQVQSIIGAQPQNIDVQGQGTFSTTGSAIKLETSCAGAAAPAAEITFSDDGARGTLIVKQAVQNRGDSYIVLEASRTE